MGVQKRKIWNLVISSVIVLLLGNVQTVLASSVTLSGILRYDGQPMSDITDVSPTFWCRNIETGQEVSGITSTYDNNTGVYSISGLPSAKVRIWVTFHILGDRPTLPGNYRIIQFVDIPHLSLDQLVNFDIGLEQIIHMTSPWDNDAIGPFTYPADPYPEHGRGLDFAWDAVPGATQYRITISIYRDPDHPDGYGRVESVLNSYVQETSFSTNLDLSNDFQHYQWSILAYGSGGNLIGLFMITYENGYGWDYRFKVVAPSDVDGVLAYDDGTGEIYAEVHQSQYLRQRFLVSDFGLSDDYLVKTVRICWWQHGLEDFTGVIKLRDRETGDLVPAASFSNPAEGWQDYDVSGSGFVSDDFYVELWQTAGYGYIYADTDAPHHGMSEFSTNSGANWHVSALEMDFMVRALVVPAPAGVTTSGYLSSDETWSGRVILTGDVTIPEGITLTILPGTTVLCTAYSDDQQSGNQHSLISLEVRGTLIAQGTPSEPIHFTSTEIGANAWDQIRLLGLGPPLAVIQNCIIENAVVGIHLHSGYAYITNNTIVNNGWSGIMIQGADPTIKNNIVVESGYGINVNAATASPHISYNDVFGNSRDYWDQSAQTAYTPSPATGNISADPLFVDAANADYHLQPSSPCIDAGDNSAIPPSVVVDLDLDVNPRGIINGIVDMGAYEGGEEVSGVEDFETNDFSKFPWEHHGDAGWDVTSRQKHSGAYSAKAGLIEHDHDQSTTLQVTLDCVSGNITFYRKVSSESGYDHLKFYIDGVEKDKWSGEEDWAQVSFGVTAGTRTFKWTYLKDGSESEGSDTAWIDDIVFPIN